MSPDQSRDRLGPHREQYICTGGCKQIHQKEILCLASLYAGQYTCTYADLILFTIALDANLPPKIARKARHVTARIDVLVNSLRVHLITSVTGVSNSSDTEG